jgi:MFS family permease
VLTAARRYRALFATPGAARVLLPSIVGRLPMGMSTLLFVLLVHQGTGSYPVAGLATAANAALMAVSGPLLGRLADAGRAATALAVAGVAQAIILIGLVASLRAGAGPVVAIALAGLAGAANPPIGAVTRVLLPRLTARGELSHAAYAFDAIVVELTFVIGPMLVAAVTAATDAYVAAVLTAVFTAVGALGLATAPLVRAAYPQPTATAPTKRGGALSLPGIRIVLLVGGMQAVAYGVLEVAIPAFAADRGAADLAGLVVAVWSVGSITGGLWYSGRSPAMSLSRQYLLLMGLNAIGFALVMLATGLLGLAAALFVGGLVVSPVTAVEMALVTRLAPAHARTEAFTWSTTAVCVGYAVGGAIAGGVAALSPSGPDALRLAALTATAFVIVGTVVAALCQRSVDTQSEEYSH